jgi:hypothetical protein
VNPLRGIQGAVFDPVTALKPLAHIDHLNNQCEKLTLLRNGDYAVVKKPMGDRCATKDSSHSGTATKVMASSNSA